MKLNTRKRLVIITQSIILDRIVDIMDKVGNKGYTVDDVSGGGRRGIRHGAHGGAFHAILQNIRIESITTESVAKKIAKEVIETLFINYAGIVYMDDVEAYT